MAVNPISYVSATGSQAGADASSRLPAKSLGQDDFLKLLVTQMSSQDPMNPISDTGFIAQMAQFSALEQSRTMESDMASMRDNQQIVQANSMLGCVVGVQNSSGNIVTGTVDAVKIVEGTPYIQVNGQSYELGKVLTVSLPQPTQ
jgi:flagellar basal-body rod modification protein FlgD